MPTNEQRRATAKRKLERQLERRAQRARRNRLLTIIGSVVAMLVVIGAVTATVLLTGKKSDDATTSTENTDASAAPNGVAKLPEFKPPAGLGSKCEYPPSVEPASKEVKPPKTNGGKVPTDPATVSISMMTNEGPIGLLLDNAKTPCTVNSFVSLAEQKYFDNTPCHRLTTSPGLKVLQCGDPTGEGTGGPGYQFANEYPTNQYPPGDPAGQAPVTYPRGTLAMANAGPNTNGSQFFLVYQDSQLPPQYTAFGKIQDDGLATLDKIAKGGVTPGTRGPDDGAPVTKVTITSVRLD